MFVFFLIMLIENTNCINKFFHHHKIPQENDFLHSLPVHPFDNFMSEFIQNTHHPDDHQRNFPKQTKPFSAIIFRGNCL